MHNRVSNSTFQENRCPEEMGRDEKQNKSSQSGAMTFNKVISQ